MKMILLKFPNPALTTKCSPVWDFGPNLKKTLDEMWDLMIQENGIGLAANQVGILNRMFVMAGPFNEKIYCVNPKVYAYSLETVTLKESCLSAPGEFINIVRPASVKIGCQDENGNSCSYNFHSIYSVCAQHEMEHLDGSTFLKSPQIPKKERIRLAKKFGLT
jgi:peptide deformylase